MPIFHCTECSRDQVAVNSYPLHYGGDLMYSIEIIELDCGHDIEV